MYEELIVALNKYFEGYELKRGDALKAADAIKQLSAELEAVKAKCEKMRPFYKVADDVFKLWETAAYSMRDDERKRSDKLRLELDQVKQERDAAVADMRPQLCLVCKKLKTCRPRREDIDDGGCSAFEWRGVAKENDERARGCWFCKIEANKNAMIEDCGYTVCPYCGRALKEDAE